MIASAPAKATTGTESVLVVPEPLARMVPLVSVSVVGFKPDRPPTLTDPTALLRVRAFNVWLPVKELAVRGVALKVWVAPALRIFVAGEYPVNATIPLVAL